jgi:SEC-C motif-containing protein
MSKEIGRNAPCPCGSGKKWKKCHGNPANVVKEPAPADLSEAFGLNGRLRIRDVLPKLVTLTTELREFDPIQVISAAATLASLADNHTFIFRLDSLIYLAASHGNGSRVPSVQDLDRWLNTEIPESEIGRFEDPPEDFAVGLVRTEDGDRLIFNGYLSGPDAYLQDVLDTLAAGPSVLGPIRLKANAALSLSNELVGRRGYDRFTAGSHSPDRVVLPETDEELWHLALTQIFTPADFSSPTSFEADLQPFVCTLEHLQQSALDQQVVQTRREFLLRLGDAFLVLFPTAIADAVIARTLDELGQLHLIRSFGNAMNRRQAGRVFEAARRHLGHQNVVNTERDLDNKYHPPGISEIALHFDGNKYLHLVVVHDDMGSALRDGLDQTWATEHSVATHLENVAAILSQRPSCGGGLTLIVVVGIGRAYEIPVPSRLPSRWSIQVWSLFDFERLQWIESDWEMMLWKISQQKKTLSSRGIEFITPDDATLYGHWLTDMYRLIPVQAIDSGPALVPVGCNEVFTLRERGRRQLDTHSVYRPDRREWVQVCRATPVSYFKEDENRSRYASPELAAAGFLAGAVVTNRRAWWIDCDSSQYPGADRKYLFKIWETAQIWLERVVPSIEQRMAGLPEGNLVITLDVSEIAAIEDWRSSVINAIPTAASYPVHANEYGFTVTVPAAFVSMGHAPVNVAERLLAEAFVSGSFLIAGSRSPGTRVAETLESLHISPDERHMHTFTAVDHRDHLREFGSDDFELARDADLHFACAEIAYEAGLAKPVMITDRGRCGVVLNQIVDAYWFRCQKRLEAIDRRSIVVQCLRNNEAILAEQDNWKRTRRAVAALHRNQSDILRASQKAREEMDRTQISHRVMIEMAICTSPDGAGREVTQEDVDYLGAQILQMTATAQESDAMRAAAIPAWLRTSLAGDFRLASDFSDLMSPYLLSHFETTHRRDIADYERHFTVPKRGTKTEEEAFGKEFVVAFRSEYGISPIRLAEVATVIADDAFERKTNVVVRAKESLRELLLREGFTENEFESLIQHFVLPSRPDWTKAALPLRSKDWWPWRYRRHLSLMARPLVALNENEITYAPGFCEDSFRHVVMEAHSGAFDTEYFSSRVMKEYIGTVNAKRGLDFNKAVADTFTKSGWRVLIEVQMSQFQCPGGEASGDIDVIAAKHGIIYLCECKELSFARTITEVVEQLGRFRGRHGDALWKHLRRVEWVRRNATELRRIVEQEPVEIRSLLVTSKTVPMQFARDFPVDVVPMDSLEAYLGPNHNEAAVEI